MGSAPGTKRSLLESVVSLYSLQAFNYLVPLVTLPYLTRTLGASNWGKLALADAYGNYVSLVVEYGFSLSATRFIALARDDVDRRSTTLASVVAAQLLLTSAVGICLVLLSSLRGFTLDHSWLTLSFLAGVARALMPAWYFQGLERMRPLSLISMLSSGSVLIGIVLLVHRPSDAWIVLALRTAAAFGACGIMFALAYREVAFRMPNWSEVWRVLRDGGSLFLFKGAISFYTTANIVILGFFAPVTSVAWYAGAEKIVRAALASTQPLTQAFYPRINHLLSIDKRKALRAVRASAILTIGLGCCMGACLLLAAPEIVRLCLGGQFVGSVVVLRVLALLPPLVAVNTVLSIQWMLPLRLESLCNRLVIFAGAINIVLAAWFAPRYRETGMAFSVVMAELFIFCSIIVLLQRRGAAPWAQLPQVEPVS
jgi:polysaccharide transporter, PST family